MELRPAPREGDLLATIATAFLWIVGLLALAFVVTVPLDAWQQFAFSAVVFAIALALRNRRSRLVVLVLMGLSLAMSARYIWWRLTQTLGVSSFVDLTLGFGLVAAELYAFMILILGYFQVAWPLNRKPVPLPEDRSLWPTVDVFIPTFNEPLSVVRNTVLAATVLDWPEDKLNIYLLDDGRREEFREFCEAVGVHYLTRTNNSHAKAGNINAALKKTSGEFVAIFDCDHMPARSFLQVSMGWLVRDPRMAVVQTPHYFFSPDPFERNLGTFGKVPNEGELFYGLLQDGNDAWNATFFCGSCAVIRRGPLEEVGGVAVETVTEDAHTALRLHRAGYRSAYIPIPQAAGLATESLSAHVGQRIRWARGMAQIFRVDNPMLGKGLSLVQRLCYTNAMMHFFYGLPRIIFLTAPLAFLFFGAHVIHASALMILAYALPHILQASLTNLRVQGKHRHLLWNEVYETTLAWYILRPTLMAVINPKLGKFNVTAKGGLVERSYFDAQIAKPYLFLLVLNLAGVAAGAIRLLASDSSGEIQTIWLNLGWTLYNVLMLGATIATSSEERQIRRAHRVPLQMPAVLHLADGRALPCKTLDFSSGGMALQLDEPRPVEPGSAVEIELMNRGRSQHLPAVVRQDRDERGLSIEFGAMSLEQERWLVASTFARADLWVSLWGRHDRDSLLGSLGGVLKASARGFQRLGRHIVSSGRQGFRAQPRGDSA
ncbi:UDP-forming cellulose synthase catalytic subunit [Pseudoxanthomonas broegbernensis]|uniref:Cellulose synthase catalytic subunit [UDP-forming] n=1 Tax=Pseudoxanthomonas broegbernensis TaxID=83619 RepID=A0A7V8GML6_9GAMM|nr:UDP-forming cellulose synthase catalytic subunit [Pseudoxanthomonas broegbernensis]KAF1686578.1 UDP-forming cellulose synthase catalytic subunit [Pseudoxanthomonas broegbernensis]MBB6063674.1 cellulose synthase (UDP-forming) [Pseudoxanthomonas broegbernensis]